jgi:hypothetical protein
MCSCWSFHLFLSFASDNIPWPDGMQGFLSWMRLALFDLFTITSVDCLTTMNFYTPYWVICGITLGILIVIPIIHRNVPALLVRFGFTDDPELGYTLRSLLIKVLAMYMTIFYPVRNEIKI